MNRKMFFIVALVLFCAKNVYCDHSASCEIILMVISPEEQESQDYDLIKNESDGKSNLQLSTTSEEEKESNAAEEVLGEESESESE